MAIEFNCPGCGQQLRVPDDAVGRQAKCPNCNTVASVPASPAFGGVGSALGGASPPPPNVGGSPFAPDPSRSEAALNPYASPTFDDRPATFAPGALGHQTVDVGTIWNHAYAAWTANLGLLVGVTFVVGILTQAVAFVGGLVQGMLQAGDQMEAAAVLGIAMFFVNQAWGIFLGVGQAQIALKVARRQPAEFSDLFNGGARFLPVVGVVVLFSLATFAGFLLLIVPGIIVLLFFWPCYWLVVDERAGVIESFGAAATISEGNRGTTFVLWLLSVGLMLLGVLAFCVGVLFAAPLVSVLFATAYLMFSGQLPAYPASAQR